MYCTALHWPWQSFVLCASVRAKGAAACCRPTRHAMQCTALHCIALHVITLHCTALHCIALHCTALHCIALGGGVLQCASAGLLGQQTAGGGCWTLQAPYTQPILSLRPLCSQHRSFTFTFSQTTPLFVSVPGRCVPPHRFAHFSLHSLLCTAQLGAHAILTCSRLCAPHTSGERPPSYRYRDLPRQLQGRAV
jgi:hypothetical protein